MKIVALGGKKGHGKSTLAKYLIEEYGYKKLAFAEKLKDVCSEVWGYPIFLNYSLEEKEKVREVGWLKITESKLRQVENLFNIPKETLTLIEGKCNPESIRRLLQLIGTDFLREQFNKNVHIDYTLNNLIEGCNYVSDDTRFKNELNSISDKGGISIWVDASKRIKDDSNISHASEMSLSECDFEYFIDNNGSLENSIKKLEEILL